MGRGKGISRDSVLLCHLVPFGRFDWDWFSVAPSWSETRCKCAPPKRDCFSFFSLKNSQLKTSCNMLFIATAEGTVCSQGAGWVRKFVVWNIDALLVFTDVVNATSSHQHRPVFELDSISVCWKAAAFCPSWTLNARRGRVLEPSGHNKQ